MRCFSFLCYPKVLGKTLHLYLAPSFHKKTPLGKKHNWFLSLHSSLIPSHEKSAVSDFWVWEKGQRKFILTYSSLPPCSLTPQSLTICRKYAFWSAFRQAVRASLCGGKLHCPTLPEVVQASSVLRWCQWDLWVTDLVSHPPIQCLSLTELTCCCPDVSPLCLSTDSDLDRAKSGTSNLFHDGFQ